MLTYKVRGPDIPGGKFYVGYELAGTKVFSVVNDFSSEESANEECERLNAEQRRKVDEIARQASIKRARTLRAMADSVQRKVV